MPSIEQYEEYVRASQKYYNINKLARKIGKREAHGEIMLQHVGEDPNLLKWLRTGCFVQGILLIEVEVG